MRAKRLLMTNPEFFEICYAINEHMKDESGKLKTIDKERAAAQWNQLRETFESLGLTVDVLPPEEGLPDMVFAANQVLPFKNSKTALLGEMKNLERKPEVAFYERWFQENGYEIERLDLPAEQSFEAGGDAVWQRDGKLLWGGHGFRTNPEVYDQISDRFSIPVKTLHLIDPNFYHLDTCFSILDEQTVAYVEAAFDQESIRKIDASFTKKIKVPLDEAQGFLAANCYCPDGKNVIFHKGTVKFKAALKENGFEPVEVDLGEFIKAGGSAYCMKCELE